MEVFRLDYIRLSSAWLCKFLASLSWLCWGHCDMHAVEHVDESASNMKRMPHRRKMASTSKFREDSIWWSGFAATARWQEVAKLTALCHGLCVTFMHRWTIRSSYSWVINIGAYNSERWAAERWVMNRWAIEQLCSELVWLHCCRRKETIERNGLGIIIKMKIIITIIVMNQLIRWYKFI